MVVMEMGYDDDVDHEFRDAVIDRVGELVDEDTDEVVDVVLLWYRDGDGDFVDMLVDALGPLADNGVVWLLTPKAGRPGHVEPSEIAEAAPTAGLQQTSTLSAGKDWRAARLVAPRVGRGRRRAPPGRRPGQTDGRPGRLAQPESTRPTSRRVALRSQTPPRLYRAQDDIGSRGAR